MRAVTHDRYTDASGLVVTERPVPTPGAGEVLIRVSAASLNAFDWHMYRGQPLFMRLQSGLRIKEPRVVGADLAGTVEATGPGVTAVAVGNRVVAEAGKGACADYAVASVDVVTVLPDAVPFDLAAASAMAGITALQALRDKGALQSGESVLVWGASGGVGHLAVQIARALGASRVEAVCSGRNADLMRSIGADDVFAYDGEGVPPGRTYDVILDTVATQPMRAIKRLLGPGGRWVIVGALGGGRVLGPVSPMIRRLTAAKALRVDARHILADAKAGDLAQIASWVADGSVAPVVSATYALEQTADACVALEAGHVAGKLVIRIS